MNLNDGDRLGRLLAVMVLEGRFALEDLDHPHPDINWVALEADRRHAISRAQRSKLPPPYPPAIPWRNLARDWITAHPVEWQSLLRDYLNSEEQAVTNPVEDLAAAA